MTANIKLAPLGDRVLVKPSEDTEDKLASGLYLPENAKEAPQRGKVLRVGPGKREQSGQIAPLTVKAGQIVIYGKYAGTKIKVAGEEILCMREEDIMAVEE